MITLSDTAYRRAVTFLQTRARTLELRLFEFHFCGAEGTGAAVIEELRAYQNPDGGFGWALEPDVRLPGSSVVATKFALQLLLDIGASLQEPLVGAAVAYLLRAYDQAKQVWPLATEGVMDAPHAPWWSFAGLEGEFGSFLANPRAGILRCLLDYRELVSEDLLDEVLTSLLAHLDALPVEMAFFDAISFLQLLQSGHLCAGHREQVLTKLRETGAKIVARDPDDWREFAIKPLWLAPAPNAPLAEILADGIQRNLDFEIGNQNEDGSWSPSWSWGTAYPESWKIAQREWSGILTLAMLRSLRDYDRIDGCPQMEGELVYKYHID